MVAMGNTIVFGLAQLVSAAEMRKLQLQCNDARRKALSYFRVRTIVGTIVRRTYIGPGAYADLASWRAAIARLEALGESGTLLPSRTSIDQAD